MKTRKTSDGSAKPSTKRPCAGEGVRSSVSTFTCMGILQVLVETEWVGVKELGRVEQTCKGNKVPDNIWEAYCVRMWPSTQYIQQNVILDCYGGFRSYTKQRSKRREWIKNPTPSLSEPRLESDAFGFIIDAYLNDKVVLSANAPGNYMRKDTPTFFSLNEPIVLGRARCLYERECSCGKDCCDILSGGNQFPPLLPSFCVSLTLLRDDDVNYFVQVLDPKDFVFELVLYGDGFEIEPDSQHDNSFKRSNDRGDQTWLQSSNITSFSRQKKYEDFGLPLICSSQSSALRCRLKNRPIEIGVRFKIDLLDDYKTYGLTHMELDIFYGKLIERSITTDRLEWDYLCVEEGWEKFNIKRLHVLELLKAPQASKKT